MMVLQIINNFLLFLFILQKSSNAFGSAFNIIRNNKTIHTILHLTGSCGIISDYYWLAENLRFTNSYRFPLVTGGLDIYVTSFDKRIRI